MRSIRIIIQTSFYKLKNMSLKNTECISKVSENDWKN